MVTVSDLRDREPELARLMSSDYEKELEALIDKASSDFCSDYKLEFNCSPPVKRKLIPPLTNSDGAEPSREKSPYDMLIEFLALSYVFESLINTNDIYVEKATRYRALYNEKFDKLKSRHDNGLYATCETIGMLR